MPCLLLCRTHLRDIGTFIFVSLFTVRTLEKVLFGLPTHYYEVNPECTVRFCKALEEANAEFKCRMHKVFFSNCHSHLATVLNKYHEDSSHNMLSIFYLKTKAKMLVYDDVVDEFDAPHSSDADKKLSTPLELASSSSLITTFFWILTALSGILHVLCCGGGFLVKDVDTLLKELLIGTREAVVDEEIEKI